MGWRPILLYAPSGDVEVLLHHPTGWVVSPVLHGWCGVHSLTAVMYRDDFGRPRLFESREAAQLELESVCPDCYGAECQSAPCEACGGTGRLGGPLPARAVPAV